MLSVIKKWQLHLLALRENKIFEFFVIAVILISALVIGAKTYDFPEWALDAIGILDLSITVFFLFELSIRMLAEKRFFDFFKKGWNVFDFIIVGMSLIPLQQGDMVLLGRLLRVFRVLRLISMIPELRVLMNAFLLAIPRMGYVSLLMFIIFYMYAATGSIFFSEINPDLWGNISIALLTLFRVATFEDWTDVMYETMEVYPFSWIFYLSFIFIVAFVFLNMMIGIVLNTLQTEHDRIDRESGEGEAGEVHKIHQTTQAMEERLERMEKILQKIEGKP